VTHPTFAELNLAEPILKALAEENYVSPTPIQAQSIPTLIEGRDLLGIAQTGTGKTAAFALPMLNILANNPLKVAPKHARMLVLAPTRELAVQIADGFKAYGRHIHFKGALLLGGVGQGPQVAKLSGGVDVLVATPGRLLDLMGQGHLKLDQTEVVVLDEADRMLDMGFIIPVRKIVAALPKKRQTLFFSATMPPEVEQLSRAILNQPVKVEVTPPATTVERIEQKLFYVEQPHKPTLLAEMLADTAMSRVIVFTRTKHGANRVVETLEKSGIEAAAIHGNKSQNARQAALNGFKQGKVRVLVATDIASRGIDVDNVSHVVNYELPDVADTYVHRIGRTARAGSTGIALSFCAVDERALLRDIESLTRQRLNLVDSHPYRSEVPASAPVRNDQRPQRGKPQQRSSRSGGGNGGGRGGDRRQGQGGRRAA
jgi:ATP-dependent RNA helicase RhlE